MRVPKQRRQTKMEQTEKKMLGILNDKIAAYEGMVEDDMRRVRERKSPEMIAIAAEDLDRHNYALSILKELKAEIGREAK